MPKSGHDTAVIESGPDEIIDAGFGVFRLGIILQSLDPIKRVLSCQPVSLIRTIFHLFRRWDQQIMLTRATAQPALADRRYSSGRDR